MNDKITEIKEALGKATLGPWEIEKRYDGYMVVQRETFEVICSSKLHEKTENNHKLISNAPEYITYLLQELIKVQSERFEYEKLSADNQAGASRLARELEWYANEINWSQGRYEGGIFFTLAEDDGGKKAREALSY